MRFRKGQSSLLLAVVAVLFMLLPLLAYLQYDWLGKVSDREREQMQTSLRHTLAELGGEFDRQITRIFTEFQRGPEPADDAKPLDDYQSEYAKAYSHWTATARYPKLVRDIFLAQPVSGGKKDESLLRLAGVSQTWEPADWTTEFGPRRELQIPIDGRIPAIVIPIFRLPREPVLTPPERLASIVVRLDRDYICNELIPALVQAHFGGLAADYRIQVQDDEDGATADASEPILTLRPDDFHLADPLPPPMPIGPMGVRRIGGDVFSVRVVRSFDDRMPATYVAGGRLPTWKLTAVHRSGSLDAAVSQARRRNLAVSFSILALLAASMVIILVSAAHEQRNARRQVEFVSAVSHELRTPLAVIRSAGENLADGLIHNQQQLKSYGELIRNEGRRLSDMVEQVLSFAGVQPGLKARSFISVDLSKVLEQAINGLEIPIRENGFSIERNIPENLPFIMGDSVSLTRAVQNLLGNAIKYGAAARWIAVSIVPGPRMLTLAVQDRGSGILSSDLPHIFDPFYRGRTAIEGQIQGSGLGLSIVKQVVESHGGRIEVSSSPGVGSTFSIQLPVAQSAETK